MTLTSPIKKSRDLRLKIIIAVCLIFGLWGVYDLIVAIPHDQQVFDQFQAAQQRLAELENQRDSRQESGQTMTDAEIAEYQQLEQRLNELAPDGENPVPPSKFDALMQWFFILLLPGVPYYIVVLMKEKRRVYRLDEDGTLHLPDPDGVWKPEDITDIDMSRWMSKSVAEVIHTDGRRVKLDDYIYDKLHLIVGSIAHRLHPEEWDAEAHDLKKAKTGKESGSGDESDSTPAKPESDSPET